MVAYLDNAATTPLDPQVISRMTDVMENCFGNASAIHAQGRKAKAVVEMARKNIAKMIHCESTEIVFTSSGTEADNMAIRCAVNDLGVRNIITSNIEHKAVLDTSKELMNKGLIQVHFVHLDENGKADLEDLEKLAIKYPNSLISLMHANNELGSLNDIEAISKIARANSCYFHTDTVQTIGHYPLNLKALDVDFIACSAHKFHGPKGVGFLYKNRGLKIRPIVTGGGQESALRAGTENVYGIAGLEKALEIATTDMDEKIKKIQSMKHYFIDKLKTNIADIEFNGDTSNEGGLYTVLNVSLPPNESASTLLFQLDMNGICASGGSACNSGAVSVSHVLHGINHPSDRTAIRFSLSKFTTRDEIDFAVAKLIEIIS